VQVNPGGDVYGFSYTVNSVDRTEKKCDHCGYYASGRMIYRLDPKPIYGIILCAACHDSLSLILNGKERITVPASHWIIQAMTEVTVPFGGG
jgi:hypothetical protein